MMENRALDGKTSLAQRGRSGNGFGLLAFGLAIAAVACAGEPTAPGGGKPGAPLPGAGRPPSGVTPGQPGTPSPPPVAPGGSPPAPGVTPVPPAPGTPTPPVVGPNPDPPAVTPVPPPGGGDAGVSSNPFVPPPPPFPVPLPAYPPPAPPSPPAASDVVFDPPGGAFIGNQSVRLSAGAGNAVIRFTVDGSLPTGASPAYSGPIAVRETTILRAIVDSSAAGKGEVGAAVYLRAEGDVAGFESSLPIVVLHTHTSGALNPAIGTPTVPGSASVFEPGASGRARLVGPATFTKRAGVRFRGNSSRSFAQKSLTFELRQEGTDDDDDRVVAGLPSDSDWNLIAPSRVDRSLIRTALAFTLSNEIQRYAPRVRMVEVFTVQTGPTGTVGQAAYQGVYTLTEKIKASKNRIRVADINPAARTEPEISGGYVLRVDHGLCNFIAGTTPFQVVEPDYDRVPMEAQTAFNGYLQTYLTGFFDATRATNFTNATTGKHYSQYIDVGAFIDHNMLNALFKNVDALRFSAYYHKDKNGLLAAGPLWDVDRSSGTPFDDDFGSRTAEPREWARADGTHPLRHSYYGRLFADPMFKEAYNQRFAMLTGGPFSVAHLHALIDFFAAQVAASQARHFAKWTQYPPTGGAHANEIQILKDWFAARVPWMSEQLR